MDVIGAVRSSSVDEERWSRFIDECPLLVRPEPERRMDPFTRKLVDITSFTTTARVVGDGVVVGEMAWCGVGDIDIVVLGRAELVTPVARDVAALVGGTFDTSCDLSFLAFD